MAITEVNMADVIGNEFAKIALGTSSADVSAAFEEVLHPGQGSQYEGVKVMKIPAGRYYLDHPLEVPRSMIIQGEGPAYFEQPFYPRPPYRDFAKVLNTAPPDPVFGTELHFRNVNNPALTLIDSTTTLRDLSVWGDNSSSCGLRVGAGNGRNQFMRVSNVGVYSFTGDGIQVKGNQNALYEQVHVACCRRGIWVGDSSEESNGTLFRACFIEACKGVGVQLTYSKSTSFESCRFFDTKDRGMLIQKYTDEKLLAIVLRACRFEECGQDLPDDDFGRCVLAKDNDPTTGTHLSNVVIECCCLEDDPPLWFVNTTRCAVLFSSMKNNPVKVKREPNVDDTCSVLPS